MKHLVYFRTLLKLYNDVKHCIAFYLIFSVYLLSHHLPAGNILYYQLLGICSIYINKSNFVLWPVSKTFQLKVICLNFGKKYLTTLCYYYMYLVTPCQLCCFSYRK